MNIQIRVVNNPNRQPIFLLFKLKSVLLFLPAVGCASRILSVFLFVKTFKIKCHLVVFIFKIFELHPPPLTPNPIFGTWEEFVVVTKDFNCIS